MKKILTFFVLVGFLMVNFIPYAHAAIYTSKVDEYLFDIKDKPKLSEWQPHDLPGFTYTNWFTGEKQIFNNVEPSFSMYSYFETILQIDNGNYYSFKKNVPFFAVINNANYHKDAKFGFSIHNDYSYSQSHLMFIVNDVDGDTGNTCLYIQNSNARFKRKLENTCIASENLRQKDPYIIFFNIHYSVVVDKSEWFLGRSNYGDTYPSYIDIDYIVTRDTLVESGHPGLSFYKPKHITYNSYDWNTNIYSLHSNGRYYFQCTNGNSGKCLYGVPSKEFYYYSTKGQIRFYGLKFSKFIYEENDIKEELTNEYFDTNFFQFPTDNKYYSQQLSIKSIDFLDQLAPFVIKRIYGGSITRPTTETAIEIDERNGVVNKGTFPSCGFTDVSCQVDNFLRFVGAASNDVNDYIGKEEEQKCGWTEVGCHISKLGNTIKNGFLSVVSGVIGGLKSIFLWIFDQIKSFLVTIFTPILKFFEPIWTDILKPVWNFFYGFFKPLWELATGKITWQSFLWGNQQYICSKTTGVYIDTTTPASFRPSELLGFFLLLINPIPPEDGSPVCTSLGMKNLDYGRSTFLDTTIFLFFVIAGFWFLFFIVRK